MTRQPALLRYPGAKWALGPRIAAPLPEQKHYDALAGWRRKEIQTATHGGRQRTEVIWRNHQPTTSTQEM